MTTDQYVDLIIMYEYTVLSFHIIGVTYTNYILFMLADRYL